jgi:signal transduction histidine kinase
MAGGETGRAAWQSDDLAGGVLASLRDHVAVVDSAGNIIAVNEAWRRFARDNDAKSPEAVLEGANYLDVCKRSTADGDEFAIRALGGLQSILREEADEFSMEYPCSSPDVERWFFMTVVPLQLPGGGCVVSHTDVTERKKAERDLQHSEQALRESREQYRLLARRLLSAHEDASRQLARELHDDLSQRLAVLAMDAGKLAGKGIGPDVVTEGLKRIQEQVSALSRDIHAIARQLHPSILDDLGLDDAVKAACATFSEHEGIHVDYKSVRIPKDLSPEVALNLYRIIQEALNNIAKHAGASTVSMSIEEKNETIYLSVADNGAGFDRSDLRKIEGLGLASMRERVDLIRGALTIETGPGEGTKIRVVVPFAGGAGQG